MHRVLKQALAQAVAWHELVRNEAAGVKPPKVERKPMKALDTDGTAALIELARDASLFIPILLAVTTGMRRGEIAALRWRHIDLDRGQISIEDSADQTKTGVRYKPPKSGKGRTVALAKRIVEELRNHRVRQAEALLMLGIRLSEHTFVVAQADGSPFQPRSLTHGFQQFLAKHRLPRIRPHDLRHTHATAMLKGQGPSQGRPGTPRALDDRGHARYLFPRPGGHAGRRRRDRGGRRLAGGAHQAPQRDSVAKG
jgi:integrase